MERPIYIEMRQLEDEHWWFAGRRMIMRNLLLSLRLPETTRILDVGCGTGGNLSLLSEFGKVTGMEHDAEAAEIARARGICTVYQGSLPDKMPFSARRFNLIVLLDVLEHISDDLKSLKKLNSLLEPMGYLIVSVPAFSLLWGQHDIVHHHKRRYSYSALRNLIHEAGFKIALLSYYNTWLFPFIATVRLCYRLWQQERIGSDAWLPPSTVNRFLECLFGSERHLLPHIRMPFGISLVGIAYKE